MSTTEEARTPGQEEAVTILYTNYRGETAVRRITPIAREWFGSSDWHPEPQWLFTAFDMDKEAFRDFARSGVKAWGQAAVDAALASAAPRADSAERTVDEEETEAEIDARIERLGDRENMRLIDRISDLIGLPHNVELTLDHVREALAQAATPAPSSPGVPDSVRALPLIEIRPVAEALHERLDRHTWAALCRGGDYGLPGTDQHWLKIAEAAIIVVKDAIGAALLSAHPAGQSTGQGADLSEPHAVFKAMHAGEIAKPTLDRLVQLYGADTLRAHLARLGPETDLAATARSRGKWGLKGGHDTEGTSKLLIEIADCLSSLPDSTRMGPVGPGALREAVSKALHDNQFHDDWNELVDPVVDAVLAARPAAPEAQGAWMDISTAPRDGSKFDAWAVDPSTGSMGVRFADVQMRGDGSGFGIVIHQGDAHWEYLERQGPTFPAWKLTHWRRAPAPPASSGQESA